MTSRLSYISLLATCVLLVTMMLCVETNYRAFVEKFRDDQELEVYLYSSTSALQLESIVSKIKQLPGYTSFDLQDREVAFDQMQQRLGEDLLPDMGPNPFPDRILVRFSSEFATLDNFQLVAPQLQRLNSVDTVTFNATWLAAQEEAFSRWNLVIIGTLLLSIVAGLFSVLLSTSYAEQRNRNMLMASRIHGASLRFLARRFMGDWLGYSLLAAVVGIAAGYLVWEFFKSRFSSELFVEPLLLLLVVVASVTAVIVGLLFRLLCYR